MFQAYRPAVRAVAVAALLSSFAALPALAQTSPAAGAAPAARAPASSATAVSTSAAKEAKHSAAVEAHIANLKKKLMITPAQDSAWNTFAEVMRDNGEAIEAAVQERDASKNLDAIHDLQSYAKVAQVHADGAQKLAAAFQPVYDTLSPEQKKNADTMFEHTRHGKMDGGKKKS
jgi:protein CpxP